MKYRHLQKPAASLAMLALAVIPCSAMASTSATKESNSVETLEKESAQAVSAETYTKADPYVHLQDNHFVLDDNINRELSAGELKTVYAAVEDANQNIEEMKSDRYLEMKTNGKAIRFEEKGPRIASTDGDNFTPYFQEGRNAIEVGWSGVTIYLSKGTVNTIGAGVALGGVWIPEPVVSKIVASLGIVLGAAPGGIAAKYGIGSIIAGAMTHNAIPERVWFQ